MDDLARVEIERRDGVIVAQIFGDVDISNAEGVLRELMESVPNTALGLVVDVSKVGHLDSSGVSLLFELARALERRQQMACVVAPPRALSARVLQITRLDELVPMAVTLEEGVERVARAPSG
jgi:anti-sigma B factor antagonist